MRAILVSVDYGDILERTLPYNRHHFDEVLVVTTPTDFETIEVATQNDAEVYTTEVFYEEGAIFNKWKALEEGLDFYGRHGWMVLLDADVFWPGIIPEYQREVGYLYAPLRRMMRPIDEDIPPEEQWSQFKVHRNVREWAGYSQIFHADDTHLGPPPWHQTNWTHAGGADSFFQRKWPASHKIRPPFEVLHIGAAAANWCGRVSDFADGQRPQEVMERKRHFNNIFTHRRAGHGFTHERY